MEHEKQYLQGRLYQYTGKEFVELESSGETKLPVSAEAMDAVKQVRKAVQNQIRLRPELGLVASAMLLAAFELPDLVEFVQRYGQRVYSKVGCEVVLDDKEGQS